MSHEIYYTSAPQGLRRGASGFCTVAATADIPKALWDRLETLSAYRHHYGAHCDEGEPGAGRNPVSHAHWILSVSGKTHHVLSRVCDSGVDHTQRTNAFAHHLALDNGELEAAPGGPAWLLEQALVMAPAWDGQVGTLARRELPRGGASGARICRGWEAVAGDAGWGGHLADLFARSPTRPVCILFSPDQSPQMLSLLGEALALLPAAARWNVTFNTYFTSMPTSATCLWRCCLAGTPAAQTARRYAAGGLVLDLTDRARLPALPDGPYVTMARTGEMPAAPMSAQRPIIGQPAGTTAGGIRRAPGYSRPPAHDQDQSDSEEGEYDLAVPDFSGLMEQDAVEPAAGSVEKGALPPGLPYATARPMRSMRRAEDALLEAERLAVEAAHRRRRHVLYLFIGSLGAIALGSLLIVLVNRHAAPPPPIPEPVPRAESPVQGMIPDPVELTTPIPQPVNTHVPPIPTQTVETQPEPQVDPQPTGVAVTYPQVIELSMALEKPNLGTGIGDRVQSIPMRAQDLDTPATIGGLRLAFGARAEGQSPGDTFRSPSLGILTAVSENRAGRPATSIRWRGNNDPAGPSEAAVIIFERVRPGLEIQWRSAMLLRNPALIEFLYWALQSSTLELESRTRPAESGLTRQQIRFKPFEPAPLDFEQATTEISWPVTPPADVTALPPAATSLPVGWEATWYTEWEGMGAALRSVENASQVIKFKKPTSLVVVDAWFLVTFGPGMSKVESTFARRRAADEAELERLESALRSIERDIAEAQRLYAALTNQPVPPELIDRRNQVLALIDAHRTALGAYNELTGFSIAFELEGARLAELRFQRPTATPDPGK